MQGNRPTTQNDSPTTRSSATECSASSDRPAWYEKTLARRKREVEQFNSTLGTLGQDVIAADGRRIKGDGYDCPLCNNRGIVWIVQEDPDEPHVLAKPCGCYTIRNNIRRLRESGLEGAIERFTFDNFEAKEPWQVRMLEYSKRYVAEGFEDNKWLYYGGQPGSGKTMLATAVTGELLKRGVEARYVVWPQTAKHLKALAMDAEAYEAEIMPFQTVQLLYVDDFLKPIGTRNASSVTQADVKLAFEILNQRMVDRLPTIISSEWYVRELADLDEALASRVYEMSEGYRIEIKRDKNRNHRWMKSEVI